MERRKPGWHQQQGVRRFLPYRVIDVYVPGKKPRGHPRVKRAKRGKVIVGVGQVWVEIHTDALWQIAEITYNNNGDALDIFLRPYRCRTIMKGVSEKGLRLCFQVWEKAMESKSVLTEKVAKALRSGEGKALGLSIESGFAFLGIDPFSGFRKD